MNWLKGSELATHSGGAVPKDVFLCVFVKEIDKKCGVLLTKQWFKPQGGRELLNVELGLTKILEELFDERWSMYELA